MNTEPVFTLDLPEFRDFCVIATHGHYMQRPETGCYLCVRVMVTARGLPISIHIEIHCESIETLLP